MLWVDGIRDSPHDEAQANQQTAFRYSGHNFVHISWAEACRENGKIDIELENLIYNNHGKGGGIGTNKLSLSAGLQPTS